MTAQDPSFSPGIAARFLAFLRTAADAVMPAPVRVRAASLQGRQMGFVSLVGAGPGSADLVTLRGLERIRQAHCIFYDRLADPALLAHAPRGAGLVYVGKAPGRHAMPQDRINALLVDAARRGKRVVRLKCGDPGIFARGAEEATALDTAGVPWEIVPGVTSASAAAASAGSFLTERGRTERVILVTGHSRAGGSAQDWTGTAQPGTTLVCYMGVAAATDFERGLIAAGWPAACPVEVVSNSQTPQERVLTCQLRDIARIIRDHCVQSPSVMMVRWPLSLADSEAGPSAATGRARSSGSYIPAPIF